MARSAVHDLEVDVGARPDGEALEEIVHELRLEIADPRGGDLQIYHRVRPASEVDGGDSQRFVARHDEVAGPIAAAAMPERLRHRLAKRDSEIFDRVMLIHVEIAPGPHTQIERAVPREELEHVV